jgi:hypothetical protein
MKRDSKLEVFLDRFQGRTDVYGTQYTTVKDGKEIRSFHPVCSNFWKPFCHLRTKSGTPCASCDKKEYKAIDASAVEAHLSGESPLLIYVLRRDSTIRFGAIDFDYKPGKEVQGYKWEDVEKICKLADEWGIKYGVARSTGLGFHVYFFFENACPANKFRAVIFELFERVGFMEENRQGIRPLPEIFPRQSTPGDTGFGNGIKPPMIEANWGRERNCFVSGGNKMIPADNQWQHLASLPRNTAEQIEELIKTYDIPVLETETTTASPGSATSTRSRVRNGKWEPPLNGSFEKMLQGCAALRVLRDKVLAKETPGHWEGFCLYHLAMHTADGLKWFEENVSGWGTTDAEKRQLDHSIQKDYNPWSCKKLQELALCSNGTKCFDKKPPYHIVEGQLVHDEQVPQEEWPEPSPLRYAFGRGEDFLLKLQNEIINSVQEQDSAKREAILKRVIYRAQVFDEGQQAHLKKTIVDAKLIGKRDVNKLFSAALNQKTEEVKEAANARSDTASANGNIYRKATPYGYTMLKNFGSTAKDHYICNVDIEVQEARTYIDPGMEKRTVFLGVAKFAGQESEFSIPIEDWGDNGKFYIFFLNLCGGFINILRPEVDYIRQAVMAFSSRTFKPTIYYSTQGWYGDTYIMPSLIIDRDGIRPNEEKPVDLSGKEFARSLDFKILGDTDFRETLMHLKRDFFNTFPRHTVLSGIAHSMGASIMDRLRPCGVRVKPTLWYEGLTGTGKSALCYLLQAFYGDFPPCLNWQTTSKSTLSFGHDFKDCMLYVDDYKNLPHQIRAAYETVQYAYDDTVRGALNRSGRQRGNKNSRCLFLMSGEMTPSNEASVIARMTLFEYPKGDNFNTQDRYEMCKEFSPKYCGITPRFIHFFLQRDINEEIKRLREICRQFQAAIRGIQNADRIAQNIGINYYVFEIFCDFLVQYGICDIKEGMKLREEHFGYCIVARDQMAQRCAEEQNGIVFLSVLQEMLLSGRAAIKNLKGFDRERAEMIGYIKDGEENPKTAYLLSNMTYHLVMKQSQTNPIPGTLRSITNQLKDLGVIVPYNNNNNEDLSSRSARVNGKVTKVWEVSLERLIGDREPHLVLHQNIEPKYEKAPADAEGLI